VSDLEILTLVYLLIATVASFWLGHRKGVSNTVSFLEDEGILEFKKEKP